MNPIKTAFRLTLTAQAIKVATDRKSKPILGFGRKLRSDGRFDVAIKAATANLLKQLAYPGENLSDTVIRVLKKG